VATRRAPQPAPLQAEPPRVPVIDIYARISRAVNGETIKVDDQVEMWTVSPDVYIPASHDRHCFGDIRINRCHTD
jgi:hypothetical protein